MSHGNLPVFRALKTVCVCVRVCTSAIVKFLLQILHASSFPRTSHDLAKQESLQGIKRVQLLVAKQNSRQQQRRKYQPWPYTVGTCGKCKVDCSWLLPLMNIHNFGLKVLSYYSAIRATLSPEPWNHWRVAMAARHCRSSHVPVLSSVFLRYCGYGWIRGQPWFGPLLLLARSWDKHWPGQAGNLWNVEGFFQFFQLGYPEVVVGPPNGHVCDIRHAPSGGGLQITHEETLFLGTRKFKINLRGSNKYVVILNII